MYDAIALICIVIFFQILMYKLGCMQGEKTAYKLGCMQGEKTAYKRFTKVCNVCRNKGK